MSWDVIGAPDFGNFESFGDLIWPLGRRERSRELHARVLTPFCRELSVPC